MSDTVFIIMAQIKDWNGNLEERFWKKVNKRGENECWDWVAGKNQHGYGVFGVNKTMTQSTHRFSYEFHFGKIPKGEGYHGNCVLHRCDNPACVNPKHLFLGTQKENMEDMLKKGRIPRGEVRYNAKLTWDNAREIRELHRTGEFSQQEIGKKFGVTSGTISFILNNKNWRIIA